MHGLSGGASSECGTAKQHTTEACANPPRLRREGALGVIIRQYDVIVGLRRVADALCVRDIGGFGQVECVSARGRSSVAAACHRRASEYWLHDVDGLGWYPRPPCETR